MRFSSRELGVSIFGMVMASAASAACPTGATCFFGTDTDGSSTTRASNVNSAATAASFLSGLTGVGTESFESFGDGTSAPIMLSFPGAGTAALTGSGSVIEQGTGTDGNGRYPVSGSKFYQATSAAGGGSTFRIDFSAPVAAFGFYGNDIGEFASQLSLSFSLLGGETQVWTLPYTATNGINSLRDGSLLYAGFINTQTFTSVSFLGTSSADTFGFDDMTIAAIEQVMPPVMPAIPEPETWALLLAGLAGLGAVGRRRRGA